MPISDPFYDDVQYEWKSVDERVATVDQSGVVTGVSAGSTEVRAFYGDNRLARCLVSVVESTSSLPDPTAALSEGLSQQMIFSSNQLPYKGTIMQCFDFYDENGYIVVDAMETVTNSTDSDKFSVDSANGGVSYKNSTLSIDGEGYYLASGAKIYVIEDEEASSYTAKKLANEYKDGLKATVYGVMNADGEYTSIYVCL